MRRGFTLLEVVLAIGLCGAVMALLVTAIDLYLVRVDTSRTQVESSQLARTLLNKIAEDLRAARYATSSSSAGQPGLADGSAESGFGSDAGSSSGPAFGQSTSTDLGIYGTLTELRIDRATERNWRQVMVPAAEIAATTDPYDMPQTVEYFFEEGRVMTLADLAAGGVSDNTNLTGYTGLYRRQTPTASIMSTTAPSARLTESQEPAELLAPEVVQISFMYSDAVQWFEEWDSSTQQGLPAAVEIKVTLFADVLGIDAAQRDLDEEERRRDPARWVEHRLVVRIPQLDEPQQLSGPAAPDTSQPQQPGGP